jgi:hypothetical protein
MQLKPNLNDDIQQSQNPDVILGESKYLVQLQIKEKLIDLKKTEDENSARSWLTEATFTVTVFWLMFVAGVFITYGKGALYFSDTVMITFLTTTTANTLAFLTIIFKYLFHKPKP